MSKSPLITLINGTTIPQLGFGTLGVPPDRRPSTANTEKTAQIVGLALEVGYRPTTYARGDAQLSRSLERPLCGKTIRVPPGLGDRPVSGSSRGKSRGIFDDPNWLELKRHVWIRSAQRWMPIPHGVERFDLGSLPAPK